MVLRPEGAEVLRDRLPAAGGGRLGPVLRGQRHGHLPGVGERDHPGRDRRGPVTAVRQRDGRAAARSGRQHHRLLRGRGAAAAVRRVGDRRAPARAGHRDAAGGGRVHGQRLRADAPPGLRHAARDARRRGPHAARVRPVKVTLLGPQRRPTVDAVAASRYPEGPIATITAGWQDRESDDGELGKLLGGRDVNLGLYHRWLDVTERDPLFAAGERRLAELLDELAGGYLLRLGHALEAVYAIQLGGGAAVVVTGGHVGVLADVLHLFNVAAALRSPVIAWSAGAMALTERIVLFGDRSAHGPGHPEIYGAGLSVLRGVVPLPHARARLLLDDAARMSVFARRFAPARCVLLEHGTRIDADGDGGWPPGSRVLGR